MKKKILITGATGSIGRVLVKRLLAENITVHILTRGSEAPEGTHIFNWDPQNQEVDPGAFEGVQAIFHLAGAGIADKKWTRSRKAEILDSRVKSADLIYNILMELPEEKRPDTFISSSAVGIYGYDTGSLWVTEESNFGDDFLATVCKEWEAAANRFEILNMRVVKLRTGFVLSYHGGALPAMVRPVKWGLGAGLGRGDQYLSWIHINDLIGMFLLALENQEMKGSYNAVGPDPVTNKEMMRAIALVLKKPFFMPDIPSYLLKIAMGEMASLVTGGNRVSSKKIESLGFKFQYSDLQTALRDLLNR